MISNPAHRTPPLPSSTLPPKLTRSTPHTAPTSIQRQLDPAAANLDTDLPEESTAAAATEVIDAASDVRQVTDSPSTNDAQDDHSTKPSAALSHDAGPSDGSTSRRIRAASGTGRAQRLPAGGLRGLVEDYLREHPDAAFGPSQIGKDLSRSGGAVANALTKLVERWLRRRRARQAPPLPARPRRDQPTLLAETRPPTPGESGGGAVTDAGATTRPPHRDLEENSMQAAARCPTPTRQRHALAATVRHTHAPTACRGVVIDGDNVDCNGR